jgi:hypothetical protein
MRFVALLGGRFRSIVASTILMLSGLVIPVAPAAAVPSFATQTGQPCTSCHVGGFGPQLTPFGREFKLHGYTMRAVGQFDSVPISAMAIASLAHTSRDQPGPAAPHFGTNDNVALDQASLFLATGIGSHFGAFVQATYDGVGRSFSWDNLDLRATTDAHIGGTNVVLGLSLNNSPGVQDPWNTLPAWGYPYTDSALVPGPAASPLIAGGLAQNTIGLSAYAWWNSSIYTEAGLYWSPSGSFLSRMGVDPAETSQIRGSSPYLRVAYQRTIGNGTFEVGAFGLFTSLYPGRDRSTGMTDRYRDLGVDASYQLTSAGGNTLSLNSRYTHERQNLAASQALGNSTNRNLTLNDLRLDLSYYHHSRIGGTVGLFDTWGTEDPLLYPDSRRASPDSSGMMLQLDATPFGHGSSPLGPRFNARVGIQYFMYSRFDGARRNYDGTGRNASDNNMLRVFLWLAY